MDLVRDLGMEPDEWQVMVLESWLGRDATDKFTATTCGLSVPRQNGKNAALEFLELYHLVAIGSRILHTAHEVKTARKAFLRLASFFEDPRHPELADMVLSIRRTNGQEAIELSNGGGIEFSARSKGSARGFTVDLVVFDEASFLTEEQIEAIMSTMAAAPLGNRQLVMTGTPPAPSMPCEVFGRTRRAAIEGRDRACSWHEWSVESPPGKDEPFCSIVDLCYMTNPALGIRLDEGFTESEYTKLTPDGFARERLGWWESSMGTVLVKPEQWAACMTTSPPPEGRKVFGVKFTPDGSYCALSVALRPKEGPAYVECIFHVSMRDGVGLIADFLMAAKDSTALCVIDGRSHSDALVARLRERGYPRRAICLPRTADVIAAASMFHNAIKEGSVSHSGQPAADVAIQRAAKRPIGSDGGWGWGTTEDDADSSIVESMSNAFWGVMTTKRDPSRKMKVRVR